MNPHALEQELLKIYPRSYKITAFLLGCAFIGFILFGWQKINLSKLEISNYVQIIGLLITFILMLLPRLVITTHRITYLFGPFFKQEISRDKVEDIYISPPLNYIRLTQRDTIWTKPLFGKARHPNTAEYWYKNGILNFKHSEHKKSFRAMSLSKLGLMEFSRAQNDEIIQHLKRYWKFNADRVELSPIDQIPDDITTKDVGKTVLILIFIAILIGFIGFLIPIYFFDGLHFAVESYTYLVPFILLSIGISYLFIKMENKSYPLLSALFVGLFLGSTLYFTALQINRTYSEQHAKSIVIPITFTSKDGQSQVWTLDQKWADEIGLNEIYVHQHWKNYNPNLKQGIKYQVTVKKGYFNDYFINHESFQFSSK